MKEKTKPLVRFCARCGAKLGVRVVEVHATDCDTKPGGDETVRSRTRVSARLCWSCGDLVTERLEVWLKELK